MWRVLLADPDRQDQERLARACARFGRVVSVSTVARLRREFAVRGADLIVLEHRLPDGSGLDVAAALRARWPQLPVVMATAHGSEAVCAAALRLGLRDYDTDTPGPADTDAQPAPVTPSPATPAPTQPGTVRPTPVAPVQPGTTISGTAQPRTTPASTTPASTTPARPIAKRGKRKSKRPPP